MRYYHVACVLKNEPNKCLMRLLGGIFPGVNDDEVQWARIFIAHSVSRIYLCILRSREGIG